MLIHLSLLFYALKCYIVKYFYLLTYFSGPMSYHLITIYGVMKSTKSKAASSRSS
jgi:hypothetical protein